VPRFTLDDSASNEGSGGQVPNDEVKVVNLDRVVRRPALALGLAGATFFLIGGAAAAIVAMLLTAILGLVATWVMSGEPPPVARRSADVGRRYDGRRTVAVAQLVEPRVVVPVVAGSSPVRHPL
jgi:hypothetical protein